MSKAALISKKISVHHLDTYIRNMGQVQVELRRSLNLRRLELEIRSYNLQRQP
jgi:hypothetical protein